MGAKKAANLFRIYCFMCRCDGRWVFSFNDEKRAIALWAIPLLAACQQRQAGLSIAGKARSLAIDWLGWICFFYINRFFKTSPISPVMQIARF